METPRIANNLFHSRRTLHPMQVETCATADAKYRYDCDILANAITKYRSNPQQVPGEIILESVRCDVQ